ncbi:hypothetical protein FHQ18_09100 [Deferribacter autotrophicus]|uniref:Uncharacterized protein n=1 Tax=Deferribacter autotrophicus TaxID=500465 RepID=A0A5A8F0F0_9BACT|nr:hypothetical protein [Deferribacter autotrophicus]KAA0257489.1 hypothetical protein FHQ18_09100 [Deferribacter autotrophicus]
MIKSKITILAIILLFSINAFAVVNLGTVGNTYPIVENDFYEWIINQVKKNADKIPKIDKNKLYNFVDKQLYVDFDLPDAKEHKIKEYEPVYILDHDIKDQNGNILYPKGYSYNVFDYVTFKHVYFFLNAEKRSHIASYLEYADRYKNIQPIVVKGSLTYFYETIKKFQKRPIPAGKATKLMLDKMFVKKLPSLVYQKGKKLIVEEIPAGGDK